MKYVALFMLTTMLSGCVTSDIRSISVAAAPGMIKATIVFDRREYFEEGGDSCVGVDVCNNNIE